jgi:hypothetical protein
LPILTELVLLLVKLVIHPKHVTPETPSPVSNWCTILLLSAPTRRTDPSLQAIASSWPMQRSAFSKSKTFREGRRAIWFPSNAFNSQLPSLLRCTIHPLAIEAIDENLLVCCNKSNQVHRRAVGDEIRICCLVERLLAHELKGRRTFHVALGDRILSTMLLLAWGVATCSVFRHRCTHFRR